VAAKHSLKILRRGVEERISNMISVDSRASPQRPVVRLFRLNKHDISNNRKNVKHSEGGFLKFPRTKEFRLIDGVKEPSTCHGSILKQMPNG